MDNDEESLIPKSEFNKTNHYHFTNIQILFISILETLWTFAWLWKWLAKAGISLVNMIRRAIYRLSLIHI